MKFQAGVQYTFTTPQGTISETGIRLIEEYISRQTPRVSESWIAVNEAVTIPFSLPLLPEDWKYTWIVTGKAPYVGTFPKRISKFYYKNFGIKCPTEFLTNIGNIARTHSSEQKTYSFDFTNEFDWESGDFGDGGSCYFGGRSGARQMISEADGLAVRFFDSNGNGLARAWILPHGNIHVFFNGYGMQLVTIVRVIATWAGLSYVKVTVTNRGRSNDTLWINGDSGYVMGETSIIEDIQDVDFDLDDIHVDICENCGDPIHEDDVYWGIDQAYCEYCYYQLFRECDECGTVDFINDMKYIESEEIEVCDRCYSRHFSTCSECGDVFRKSNLIAIDVKLYCEDCKPEESED